MDSYEHIFPVTGGSIDRRTEEESMLIRKVFGTAFSIGEGYFLTAGHVIQAALECEWAGIGFPYEGTWHGSPFIESELLEEYDVGVFRAEVPSFRSMQWNPTSLPMLYEVQSIGYPYALDVEHTQLNIRAFAGHVVSEQTFYGLKAKPRIYELSFQVFRGLSGAPLLTSGRGKSVAGLVIGNRATQMLIFSDKEVLADGHRETIVERYESLQLGVAIQSSALLDLHYNLLNGTLRNHLAKNDLVG
ncbi:MAG: trypsin-like peptidase domain-containing protein [Chloroflexi bacterium]|nr:trypsin-like peptidase domain-containing protein [Chloroflexota bacterium]